MKKTKALESLMNNDYTMRKGKEGIIKGNRGKMEDAQVARTDAFVKAEQAKLAKLGGQNQKMPEAATHFNAYMTNNGEHAQGLARKLTAGLDKTAFPVK